MDRDGEAAALICKAIARDLAAYLGPGAMWKPILATVERAFTTGRAYGIEAAAGVVEQADLKRRFVTGGVTGLLAAVHDVADAIRALARRAT